MDVGEQFFPQTLGFVPAPPTRLPAALEKVNSQQTEEHKCETHRNPQQHGLAAEDRFARWIIAVLHITAAHGLDPFAASIKADQAARAKRQPRRDRDGRSATPVQAPASSFHPQGKAITAWSSG
jgi:hypothetical protein